MRTTLLRLALAIAPLFAVSAANAVEPRDVCDKRQVMLQTLEHDYGEVEIGFGVTVDGALVELATAKGGTTWTLMRTMPDGTTCLVAAGQNWAARPAPVKQAEIPDPF
ncbi:MAG TPA: hypothetical protein VMV26_07010 [Alphaproteobacteria bacterium]|jgi:hypothetical protein|nr:hypothetical protein [Alphaproteobacteria bacterium]